MYIDTEPQNKLQPYVLFDWRLIAERGLRCYGHLHALDSSKSVASCEIGFLIKASIDILSSTNKAKPNKAKVCPSNN